jgi:GTP-binding protein Era
MSRRKAAGFRCGTVGIVGRPNVGKSTLLNALVGHKVSITSSKPQTTRHRISGVLTRPDVQYVFVDTPGFQTRHGGGLNRLLNRTVRQALAEADVVILVVEADRLTDEDRALVRLLPHGVPVFLVVNKVDRHPGSGSLLPFLERAAREFPFAEIVPISATKQRNLGELLTTVARYLPEQPAMFDDDALTDRTERFAAAELVREKLYRQLGDELPYGCAVTIDRFTEEGELRRIHATVVVAKANHKAIVIGKDGERLKAIASAARRDMEKLFGAKVFLEVWVRTRRGWTDDRAALRQLGFGHG